MLISFTLPLVFTKELLYTFKEARDTVRIHVGYESDNINNENAWEIRNWYLRNRRNDIIQKGQVQVKLGTFDRYVDLINLVPSDVYTFSIENPGVLPTTTVVSGIDPTIITIVDETFYFTGNPVTIGDIICTLIDPDGSPNSPRQARFTQNWSIGRTVGNGLIFSAGKVYAFAPAAIYTRNRNTATYIDFVPFAGLTMKRVPIRQVPTIQFTGNGMYAVDPPTRVIATWKNSPVGDPSVVQSSQSYDSINPVSLLDVTAIAMGSVQSIRIRAVFV